MQYVVGVHSNITAADMGQALTVVHTEMTGMQQRIAQLESQLAVANAKLVDKDDYRNITDKKGFEKLTTFSGDEKEFGDWELHREHPPSGT